MSGAKHTPGRTCDACEGFCLQPAEGAFAGALELSLRIGQRVRLRDEFKGQRVTGVVRGLSVDSDRRLEADVVLDAPLVIEARSAEDREISIWRQHVPAHELTPFDERDELIAEMLETLTRCAEALEHYDQLPAHVAKGLRKAARAAIAKATGSPA